MKTARPTQFPSSLEPLEARIAPASLTFTDIDGDSVTITTSQGLDAALQSAAIFANVGVGQQLQELRLTAAAFQNSNVSIIATHAAGGDGFVNVGLIQAAGRDLGRVEVSGDLGRIVAGDNNFNTPGVVSLDVRSFGTLGVTTQPLGGDLSSDIKGALGALTVETDVREVDMKVRGVLTRITIGGSVFGGALQDSGSFTAAHIEEVTITGTLTGGAGAESGVFRSAGALRDVTVTGGIVGGAGAESGRLVSRGQMSQITIGGLTGGSGSLSGTLASTDGINNVAIVGNLSGGSGPSSGVIGSVQSVVGVRISGDLVGGTGPSTGQIVSASFVRNVTVEGSLIGGGDREAGAIGSLLGLDNIKILTSVIAGTGERSGIIVSDVVPTAELSRIRVGAISGVPALGIAGLNSGGVIGSVLDSVEVQNDLVGGNGPFSGIILAKNLLRSVVVHGNVQGGDAADTGLIESAKRMKKVVIDGELQGGSGDRSGFVHSVKTAQEVIVTTAIRGGEGRDSGQVFGEAKLAKVKVGAIFGGGGDTSGAILSLTRLDLVRVVGNVEGGFANSSGAIISAGSIGTVFIGGDLVGGDALFSGIIESDGDAESGGDIEAVEIVGKVRGGTNPEAPNSGMVFSSGRLNSVKIGGLVGGASFGSGSITSDSHMGPVIVGGDVEGGTGDESGKFLSGGRIAGLTISGSLIGGSGSYDTSGESTNTFGQIYAGRAIGPVNITGSLLGGSGAFSGQIRGGSIASAFIGGSMTGGSGFASGALIAETTDIGNVEIRGALGDGGRISAERNLASVKVGALAGTAGKGANGRVLISAGGQLDPGTTAEAVAIGSVTIRGSTANADILAGYDIELSAVNPDAQIGSVIAGTATSTWTASNVAAGAFPGDNFFGDLNDFPLNPRDGITKLVSRIARVQINGSMLATDDEADNYGIVAQHVVSVTIGGNPITLRSGPHNDGPIAVGGADTFIVELERDSDPREERAAAVG